MAPGHQHWRQAPPRINSPSRGEIIVCISFVNERTAWHQCSGTGDNTSHALIHRGDSKDLHTCAGGANGYSTKMCELKNNVWLSYWLQKQLKAKHLHKLCLSPMRHTLRRGSRRGEPQRIVSGTAPLLITHSSNGNYTYICTVRAPTAVLVHMSMDGCKRYVTPVC